jgi:hypothetical protein
MTVGFANEQLDSSDAQEQFRDQVVTEAIFTWELPIQNTTIPNMQIQIPPLILPCSSCLQLTFNSFIIQKV